MGPEGEAEWSREREMGSGEGEEQGDKMRPERGRWRGGWEVTDCKSVENQCAVWGKRKLQEALGQGSSLNASRGNVVPRARWLGEVSAIRDTSSEATGVGRSELSRSLGAPVDF